MNSITENFLVKKTVVVALVVLAALLIQVIIKKTIYRFAKVDSSRKYAFYQIARYFVLAMALTMCLKVIGFDVTVLVASSAALLVGIGMGIQHLFGDFVAGFVVVLDGTLKVGDIIEMDGMISRVKSINLRTTTLETRDDKNIIFPNSTLTNNRLINWTHSEETSRFDLVVHVSYDSDVELVMDLIKTSAKSHAQVLASPEPFVRLIEFADYSIRFQLFFWTRNMFRVEQMKSEIRVGIFRKFGEYRIKIPLPQREIGLKQESNVIVQHRDAGIK